MPLVAGLATLGLLGLIWLDVMSSRALVIDVLLLALWVFIGYWSLWHVVYRIEYRNGQLNCQNRFRAWSFPLEEVVRVRPMRLDIGVGIIETRSRPSHISVCVSKDFTALANAILREQPDVEIRLGPISRLLDRMPWPSSFREF
ncbi:MAG TPA: hypothetical protein VFR68_02750 [Candidatus Dormibacteraeota bacterium]|nr:hypothetical protein [Candidatus Dormibacteraeota bacterium]